MSAPVKRVVIVGSGPAAWLAAASLPRAFRHRGVEVTVVGDGAARECHGYWTLPSQRNFNGLLGIPEPVFLREAQATYRLGTEHLGWQAEGSGWLHAHGEIGRDFSATPFYKYLLAQAIAGRSASPAPFSVAARAAQLGRFARPMEGQDPLTSSFTYGFHLEEAGYVALLRERALAAGVRSAEPLREVVVGDDGNVSALRLADGQELPGDLFLDCSGPRALLMSRLAGGERDDWSAQLPCDRAWSALAPALADPPPLTQTRALEAGWAWRAPLRRSTVVGFTYGSAFTSDDTALEALRGFAGGSIEQPIARRIAAGRRRRFWVGNCVALGGAALELEPLAGTELHFAQLGIASLIELFPLDTACGIEAAEYDRLLGEHADALRDYTLAHYVAGPARTGELWRAARAAPRPARLAHKLDLYLANGRLNLLDYETFEEVDWAWLLLGCGAIPAALEVQTEQRARALTPEAVEPLRTRIEQLVASMPRHIEYLQRVAAATARSPA